MTKLRLMMAAVVFSGGVGLAEDLMPDIPPQPSAIGNAVAETFNAIKHATIDVQHQANADAKQMLILSKSLETHLEKLKEQRGLVVTLQKEQLNAAMNAKRTAKTEAEKEQAKELEQASKDLKSADGDLATGQNNLKNMISRIHKMAQINNPAERSRLWTAERKNLQDNNLKLMNAARSATGKIKSADAVIKKYAGTSTETKSEAVGAFKVKLKSWSCKKTEVFINGVMVFDPKGKNAKTKEVGASADGKFTMRVALVDPRREQARVMMEERKKAASGKKGVRITAASEHALWYEMDLPSGGVRKTEWKVSSENYVWEKPEGTQPVELISTSKSGAGHSGTDQGEFSFATNAATNQIHGWVKGKIEWKGAATEEADEQCSYDLVVEPKR